MVLVVMLWFEIIDKLYIEYYFGMKMILFVINFVSSLFCL